MLMYSVLIHVGIATTFLLFKMLNLSISRTLPPISYTVDLVEFERAQPKKKSVSKQIEKKAEPKPPPKPKEEPKPEAKVEPKPEPKSEPSTHPPPPPQAKVEEKVIILASEPKVEDKVVAVVAETKAEEKVIVLVFEDVHFDFDKSTLTPEAQAILKRNIQILRENPKVKVRIAGYTSASGTEAYNQKLSERRANAVKAYLLKEGVIASDRLSTIGYGETRPAMYEAAPKEIYSKAAKANMRALFEIIVQ